MWVAPPSKAEWRCRGYLLGEWYCWRGTRSFQALLTYTEDMIWLDKNIQYPKASSKPPYELPKEDIKRISKRRRNGYTTATKFMWKLLIRSDVNHYVFWWSDAIHGWYVGCEPPQPSMSESDEPRRQQLQNPTPREPFSQRLLKFRRNKLWRSKYDPKSLGKCWWKPRS